jgi:response regulator RpfG family c-di-GMP phosphodiesterase
MNGKEMDMSILYVEDDDVIREGMHEFLNRRFNQVLVAENGAVGLDLYRNNSPDIVMTDIQMPIMNGLEMTRAILENNDRAAIIVTSAFNEANYLFGAIELGISHYLLKPLEREKLEGSLQQCVEMVRKSRTIREREDTITEAYKAIDTLIDQGEKSVNNITSPDIDIWQQQDDMLESFLQNGGGTKAHRPTTLVLTRTHGLKGDPTWLSYKIVKNTPTQKSCFLEPPQLFLGTSGNHTLYCINEGEALPDDLLLREVVEKFASHGERVRNLVWYCCDNRIICALNYPGQVAASDSVVIKNLAIQTRYMDAISAQCQQTDEAFIYTITSLARAAEANDEDTGNHILRVGEYCTAISRQLGYSDEMANIIGRQSQLHDVGKIHILPEILNKPGKLTDEEMLLMREHPIFGAKIIGDHPRLEIARTIALQHHECWDGSGYPNALRGMAISMDARIAGIADTYDALRNKRIYKPAFDHDTAFRIILEGDGRTEPSHFDPDVLNVFKKIGGELDDIYEMLTTVE